MCQLADSMSLLEKMLVGGSQKRVSLTVETVVINDALQSFEPHVEFQMYYRWFSDLWVEQLIKPWAVRTVTGSVRVYLQLSNLEFCVQLQKGRWKNNMWLTNERDPVLFEHSARAPFGFWCVPLSVLAYRQESMVLLRLWQIAGGSTMQNILLILCEVCYLSGESGLQCHVSVSCPTFSSFFCGSMHLIDVNCF